MSNESETWSSTELHKALVSALPVYVKEPFAASPRLDVRRLGEGIELSYETVYKWLRGDRLLNPRNAKKIVDRANQPDNLAILAQLNRTPPKIEDFARFVFA